MADLGATCEAKILVAGYGFLGCSRPAAAEFVFECRCGHLSRHGNCAVHPPEAGRTLCAPCYEDDGHNCPVTFTAVAS